MNEYIDLRKILKDCPKGWELYSCIHGKVRFNRLDSCEFPVSVELSDGFDESFSRDGRFTNLPQSECCLFPSSDQRDWSKFTAPWYTKDKLVKPKFKVGDWVVFITSKSAYQVEKIENYEYTLRHILGGSLCLSFSNEKLIREWTIQDAKDGDVLACKEEILLFKSYLEQGRFSLHCWYNEHTNNLHSKEVVDILLTTTNKVCPSTKEQRDRLFQRIKEAGYKWNVESKTLEEKFDPKTLKPFDRVIVRNNNGEWECAIFSHIKDYGSGYRYDCCYMIYRYCIPYNDETKHLVGTTDEAPEYYRYWE